MDSTPLHFCFDTDIDRVLVQILIGASATPNLFTPEILQDMAKFNERPIVFALSNPTSRAECTAEQAFQNTEVSEATSNLLLKYRTSNGSSFRNRVA